MKPISPKNKLKNKFIRNKNPNYRKCIKSIYINKRNITGKLNYYNRDVKIRNTAIGFKIGGIYTKIGGIYKC